MPALVAGIHVLSDRKASRGWPSDRAFTPVFDGLCPAMTKAGCLPIHAKPAKRLRVSFS